MLEVECECGQVLRVPEQHAGRKARCKACEQVLTIPGGKRRKEKPPEQRTPPHQLRFGLARPIRIVCYLLVTAAGFGVLGALICFLHWITRELSCDTCGHHVSCAKLREFRGWCPQCKGTTFSGSFVRRKMMVPGVVNMETTQSFEQEDGRTIVRAWLASQ
ncbi:hypothetical protein OAX78_02520 [Planctomycetota bacterium]|nr:hypothetical protein [Planctomycetota bacterium]